MRVVPRGQTLGPVLESVFGWVDANWSERVDVLDNPSLGFIRAARSLGGLFHQFVAKRVAKQTIQPSNQYVSLQAQRFRIPRCASLRNASVDYAGWTRKMRRRTSS